MSSPLNWKEKTMRQWGQYLSDWPLQGLLGVCAFLLATITPSHIIAFFAWYLLGQGLIGGIVWRDGWAHRWNNAPGVLPTWQEWGELCQITQMQHDSQFHPMIAEIFRVFAQEAPRAFPAGMGETDDESDAFVCVWPNATASIWRDGGEWVVDFTAGAPTILDDPLPNPAEWENEEQDD
jgi:hypothetical protein